METHPRQKLCELITNYGRNLCDEPEKFKGLLQDCCPQHTREVNVLLTALEQRIPEDLLSGDSEVPYEITAHRLIKRLYDDAGMAEEFAGWAVDSWALALGVIQTVLSNHPQSPLDVVGDDRQEIETISYPSCQGDGKRVVAGQTFDFETVIVDSCGKVIHKERKQVHQILEDLGHGVILEMVYIPGGTFLMGAPMNEKESIDWEKPQHTVTIRPFYLGKYLVTQVQYQAVMGNNPASFKGDNRPVEEVTWKDAVRFCKRLSKYTGKIYQLPSEAQWEYACRAGTTTPFALGETLTTDLANYNGNYTYANEPTGKYRQEATPVGIFPPNAFGLYDMHGNVWEWCADVWHDHYEGAPTDGSAWLRGGKRDRRVVRGGSRSDEPSSVRSANRFLNNPSHHSAIDGFRVVGYSKKHI